MADKKTVRESQAEDQGKTSKAWAKFAIGVVAGLVGVLGPRLSD